MSVYPRMFRLRQTFPRIRVEDVPGEVRRQLEALALPRKIRAGQTVAMTAGSRSIANVHLILQTASRFIRSLGAEPLIVPAMGSHGGATAAGQRAIIQRLGITEPFCECPIRSGMETVVVCQAEDGFPVHFDRHASEADHVLLCGRVRPHTQFTGKIQSGLLKMLLVGLGKHAGAKTYHAAFQDYGFDRTVRSVARQLLGTCRIVGGLAVVENAYDETARIAGVLPEAIVEHEEEMLRLATRWMPGLPFAAADVLLVDEIGKNISGAGMDTNVVGRKPCADAAEPGSSIRIKRIAARSLSAKSHGNAVGIGLADFALDRLVAQVDRRSTWINGLTANHIDAVKFPPAFATDRELLEAALTTIGLTPPLEARIQWIRNTRDLAEVECSAAYLPEAQRRDDVELLTGVRDLPLDSAGNLPTSMARLT